MVNLNISDSKAKSSSEDGKKSGNYYSVDILKTVKKLQQQHGLRHSDYQRYRSYCTRRIARLRRSLHLRQGDKRHFRKKSVTELTCNIARGIHIPLMQAERAWSYAMQLRIEANTEARKRYHVVSRLRKAVRHATEMQTLCANNRFDAFTKLEVEAYVAWINGILHFELKDWQGCIEHLKKAKMIYENLVSTMLNEDDAALYRQRIEELAPSIRYCAYNIGDGSDIDNLLKLRVQTSDVLLKNIDILMTQKNENNSLMLHEIQWQGKPISVKSEKVRVFLFSNQDIEKVMSQNKTGQSVQLLEQHLMDCKEAITAVTDNMKEEQVQKSSRINPASQQLQHLYNYLTYVKVNITIMRNLLLAKEAKENLVNPFDTATVDKTKMNEDQKSRPHDISRLYEIILQNLSEIESIVGENDDPRLYTEIQAKKDAYNAFRCYYMGIELGNLKRYDVAAVVFNESMESANKALGNKKPVVAPKLEEELKQLLASTKKANRVLCAYNVLESASEFHPRDVDKGKNATIPLIERLDVYEENPSLVSKDAKICPLARDMKPVPFKPLFFDLALNEVRFPSLKDKSKEKKSAAGITGFVKGIWKW